MSPGLTYLPGEPVDSRKFTLSYPDLREDYLRYTMMQDDEFLANVVDILHFACVVCYLKEVPSYIALSDIGVIHELVHLLPNSSGTTTSLGEIRDQFNLWCCLA